jgi:uncharacterized protein YkwD
MRLSSGTWRGAACALLLACTAPAAARASELGDAVLDELNFARTRPAAYADALLAAQRYGGAGRSDDPAAFDEAIDFLYRQRPLAPLRTDPRLAAAARAHAASQGPRGGVGHGGGGGLSQRLQSQGLWASLVAENISYGMDDPRDVVRQLIVDSGVASRGHRHNIFNPAYEAAGVGCGGHRVYGAMCVIDFAGAVVAR